MDFSLFEKQYRRPLTKFYSSLYHSCQDISVPVHKVLLLLHDVTFICLSLYFAVILYSEFLSLAIYLNIFQLYFLFFIIVAFYILFGRFSQLYTYQVVLKRSRHFTAVVIVLSLSLLSTFILFYIIDSEVLLSGTKFILTSYLFIFLFFLVSRVVILPRLFSWLVRAGIINRNLIIVGICPESIKRANFLLANKNSYFTVCGFLSESDHLTDQSIDKIPVLGTLYDIKHVVEFHKIHDILVCSESKSEENLHAVIEECKKTRKTIHILSDLYGIIDKKINVEEIGKISSFRVYPKERVQIYGFAKRTMDFVGGLTITLCLSPILLFIAILIKLDSKGPIFYRPKVIGKNGQAFTMYKFRSMTHNCSVQMHESKVKRMILENGDTKKLKNDSRITKVGKVLRKLSFDEFPQLINVIRGEMSLVGPRPCLPYEFEVMKDWQKQRVNVKPGMTGLWQIKGRDEVLFNDQIILDLYYVEHQSILFDIEILLETVPVVVFGRGGN